MAFLLCAALAACHQEPPEMGQALPALPVELALPDPGPAQRLEAAGGCIWRHPGRNPWRGDTRAALAALHVPERLRERLMTRITAGDSDGSAIAGRGGLVSEQHVLFQPSMTMTFGASTICFGTVPDFDGVQSGRLFIEAGFFIWIPDVCGNISRIYPRWEAREYEGSQRNAVVAGVPRSAQPYAPLPRGVHEREAYRDVPEPGTVALLAIGLVLMVGWFAYRRHRARVRRMDQARRAYEEALAESDTSVITGTTIFSEVWDLRPDEVDRQAKHDAKRSASPEKWMVGDE